MNGRAILISQRDYAFAVAMAEYIADLDDREREDFIQSCRDNELDPKTEIRIAKSEGSHIYAIAMAFLEREWDGTEI